MAQPPSSNETARDHVLESRRGFLALTAGVTLAAGAGVLVGASEAATARGADSPMLAFMGACGGDWA